jgi:N utilization substance protein A
MVNQLTQMIEQLSKEKGIDPDIVYRALEDAMVAAARKFFKTEEDLQASLDPETGMIDVFAVKEIVETVENPDIEMSLAEALEVDPTFEIGEFIEIPKDTRELGRIAAQTAKQVIVQKVREAEREIIFQEFSDQVGVVVNGIVRRFEGRDVILDIGRTEAILPYSEQSKSDQYAMGERLRAIIIKVNRLAKGPQITVSRSDPSLLIRLFETEIPEVYDKTVLIKNAVREGGERAKVAVTSTEATVDPVGACVGMKGSRINSVIRELKGEKIDIINHSDDIVEYTRNALNPARISKVNILDKENKILEVIVSEDQLSLAIGRRGQNVRLASKLLGWEIDIKSAEEKKREIEGRMDSPQADRGTPLYEMQSLSPEVIEKLNEAGITTIEKLVSISAENLNEILVLEDVDKAELLLGTVSAFLTMRQEAAKESEESLEETEEKISSPESDSDSDGEEDPTETEEEANLESADDETAEDQESQGNETEETRAQE